jgi:hypothetical protein
MAKPAVLNLEALREQVSRWYGLKTQTAMLDRKVKQDKDALKKIVQQHGEKDPEKGSLYLDLGGTVTDQKIACLKYQRNVSQPVVNMETAERILKKHKLWDKVTVLVPVLDQEQVYAAYYDGKISEDELSQMFHESITYSLIPLNDDNKPVS